MVPNCVSISSREENGSGSNLLGTLSFKTLSVLIIVLETLVVLQLNKKIKNNRLKYNFMFIVEFVRREAFFVRG
jgi:hypothetical protein